MNLTMQLARSEREVQADPRRQFRDWLRTHRRAARKMPLKVVVDLYGQDISPSTAYRVAVAEGIRGARRNFSRYTEFWRMINWDLPDRVLTGIWGVSRQNLRHRRHRMGVGPALLNVLDVRPDSKFLRALACEQQKASAYDGPRPH